MPLYTITSKAILSAEQCKTVTDTVTRIHCELTNAPPEFVNVLFTFGRRVAKGKHLFVVANVRNGGDRNKESLAQLRIAIQQGVAHAVGVPLEQCAVKLIGIPASWNMEGGEILPEPGAEDQWLPQG